MKYAFFIIMTLFSQVSLTQERSKLCHRWLSNQWFQGYLALSLEGPNASLPRYIMWVDRDTPYGIRAYSYEVDLVSCEGLKDLNIKAHSATMKERLELQLTTKGEQEWQPGVLSCYSFKGCDWKNDFECSQSVMKIICGHR